MELQNQIISVNVLLEPSHLKNVKATLMDKVSSTLKNKPFEEYGIITDIKEIVSVKNQEISEISTHINMIVDVSVEYYKPAIGNILKFPIKKIFNYGLFFSEHEMRILIPISTIPDKWKLEKEDENYILVCQKNENEIEKLRINNVVSIEITDIRFEKNGFSCIAKLI